jgi:hypothetical protein
MQRHTKLGKLVANDLRRFRERPSEKGFSNFILLPIQRLLDRTAPKKCSSVCGFPTELAHQVFAEPAMILKL